MQNESAFSIINLLTSIHLLLVFISFLIGSIIALLTWFIAFSKDAKSEKKFKKIINETTEKGWIRDYSSQAPKYTIITSEDTKSQIRKLLRKTWLTKLKKKKISERNIIVIRKTEDRELRLIINAFSYICGQEFLDLDFLASLKLYFSHKYVSEHKDDFNQRTVESIREKFEKTKLRDMIIKLDDPNFDEFVVLNPAPKKRGILSQIILQIIKFSYFQIIEEGEYTQNVISEKRDNTMELIEGLSNELYGIIYIGSRPTPIYIQILLREAKKRRGFVIAASENFYTTLQVFVTMVTPFLQKEWGEDYVNTEEIHGYCAEMGRKYHYFIIRRGLQIKRSRLQKLIDKS